MALDPRTAQALLECFPEPAVLIGLDYRILATNRHYRRTYGEPPSGRCCYEVSHRYTVPCDQAGEACPLAASRDSGQPQRALHLHHTPRGQEHVEVEVHPVFDGETLCCFLELIRHPRVPLGDDGDGPVGRAPAFLRSMELIQRAAPSDTTVLLLGESGTGKEVAARALHQASRRAGGPFVAVDCSGLTESLFESELFGHEKGAFTGAHARKIGLVEAAQGGTLFLDEIGDVPLNLQVKLLRLLETRVYRRVGSVEPRQADFRLVCATHRDLRQMVEVGTFRRDLYYRISPFPVTLPPLRERREDIPALATYLLAQVAPGRRLRLSEAALEHLMGHDFPGNVRELRNLLERAALLCDGELLLPEHFDLIDSRPLPPPGVGDGRLVPLKDLERRYLHWAVARHGGDRRALARALGISERTLYRKLQALKLEGRPRPEST